MSLCCMNEAILSHHESISHHTCGRMGIVSRFGVKSYLALRNNFSNLHFQGVWVGCFYKDSQEQRRVFLPGFPSAVDKHRSRSDVLNITHVSHQLVCSPPSTTATTPTPVFPPAYSSCWWLTWCSSNVRPNLLRGIVATRKGCLPSGLISCLLISWKTSMKNSLFLFPQCNILMESDGNAEPYLSGSYEEFVTALIFFFFTTVLGLCIHVCVCV